MLAMARAVTTEPALLLLDEISMGLAPRIVAELYDLVGQLAAEGIAILLVEQFARTALAVADFAAVMAQGRIDVRRGAGRRGRRRVRCLLRRGGMRRGEHEWHERRRPSDGAGAVGDRSRSGLVTGGVGLATTLTAHADQSGTSRSAGTRSRPRRPASRSPRTSPAPRPIRRPRGRFPRRRRSCRRGRWGTPCRPWPGRALPAPTAASSSLLFPGPLGQVAPGARRGDRAGARARPRSINYPIRAEARTGRAPTASYNQMPAADLTAHADADRVEGVAQLKGADQPGGATYGTMRSDSASTLTDNEAKAVASSTVNNIALAGGAVKIASVTSTAQATSDGSQVDDGWRHDGGRHDDRRPAGLLRPDRRARRVGRPARETRRRTRSSTRRSPASV